MMKTGSLLTVGLPMAAAMLLSGCLGITPYTGNPNSVIAKASDVGFVDRGALVEGEAAIAYDPDGCQNWIIDDGIEGYSSPRFDPRSGLPVCNNLYPPGTVLGTYQTESAAIRDFVPTR
jgi:hypothetical protein